MLEMFLGGTWLVQSRPVWEAVSVCPKCAGPLTSVFVPDKTSRAVDKGRRYLSIYRHLGVERVERVASSTDVPNASVLVPPILSSYDRREGAVQYSTDLCCGEFVAETAVARVAMAGSPLLEMGWGAGACVGAELSRDMSSSICAVGIIGAVATFSSIFWGSGERSTSGGGVGPDGGQGGSG